MYAMVARSLERPCGGPVAAMGRAKSPYPAAPKGDEAGALGAEAA